MCKRKFAVCRIDVLRPDLSFPEAYPSECPDCLNAAIAHNPEFLEIIRSRLKIMHSAAIQFHAAAG